MLVDISRVVFSLSNFISHHKTYMLQKVDFGVLDVILDLTKLHFN